MDAARTLLSGLIDYAGLFPPAKLGMEPAVANYGAYRKGEHRALLGRFVVPLGRVEELAAVVGERGFLPAAGEAPWQLSALTGGDETEIRTLLEFNRRHIGQLAITSLELKPQDPGAIRAVLDRLPADLEAYFEVPADADPRPFLEALAGTRGRAKIRTGGITVEAFPRPGRVAAFLTACHEARVSFKATAGLHHPVCGRYHLTYEEDSPSASMYGFLGVFVGAAMLHAGRLPDDELVALLLESDPRAFSLDGESISWSGYRVTAAELHRARAEFCHSYGSCSFTEPVDDLRELSWL
ncbi:MAG: hypothetical protein KDD11_23935 [Acidobacteria bacterium]|nr:hypothetical protein [Acidobacteriota bacterium]